MGKKLYVGNLGYGITDSDLLKMFEAYGTVESAQIIMDRDTGRSKGFGFVEMKTDQEAQAAITALNGQDSGGRALTVNEARPRPEGGARRGGGGFGGGGGSNGDCNRNVDRDSDGDGDLNRHRDGDGHRWADGDSDLHTWA
jgi:RNA recognition motif-containing protein